MGATNSAKLRLDVLLAERGYYESREKAHAAVMAGEVTVNGRVELKPGTKLASDVELVAADTSGKYVGRGALKLERALEIWPVEVTDAVCMDIGASTGGFTEVLLRAGARKVYAIDVGYGQLDWKLRNDERVVNMERTNFRHIDHSLIAEEVDIITADVSFISLKHIFPGAAPHLTQGGSLIALIKPQFEAERGQVGKRGIIRDPEIRQETVRKVAGYAADSGLIMDDVIESPITGAKGNVEFLAFFKRGSVIVP
ncbi:MAG: TlyA family RNA methyltransferase [Clostridiales Family XIII bacterium]|jgi:23S rRNA (cytidine1920-2'-O)/16S rRNA (cytidine1409-2'-O)-methyltransferase|nr:TlyA family RNA methyltransferase [Clostridiales Family XIII bacterium]